MGINEVTVKLAILGLPGIICFFIYRRLTGRSADSQSLMFLSIFLFSILAYVLLGFLDATLNLLFTSGFDTDVMDNVFYSKAPISLKQMFFAIGSGVLLAYLLSYGHRYKVINLMGQWIGATNHYGDEDVWDYFHNLPASAKNEDWVIIRDKKTGLDYYGSILVWSDPCVKREMVISMFLFPGMENYFIM